ncbi:DnaJ domain-containing protein [Candidatus Binatia bacterium]|nr:DnaJ domain-containing protein [Candidatus Binatia bacterium]
MARRDSDGSSGRASGKDRDLYAVLGVARDATPDQIKKAYRKLARKYHPDVNPGDKAAEERFKELSRAHDVLADETQRKNYDEFGDDALQAGFDPAKAREFRRWQEAAGQGRGGFGGRRGQPSGFEDVFRGGGTSGGGGFHGFEDLFGGVFGRSAPSPQRGSDLEVPIRIEFMEAVRGTSRAISLRRPEACPTCGGTGVVGGNKACARCGGDGVIDENVRLNVKIPAGVETGSRVRVAGKGGAGSHGAPAGDIYIVVEVNEHPLLEREGNDLTLEVPVTVGEALLGASIKVPTPDGEVSLKIPAGTQSGRRLRLRGKGVPDLHGGARGDFYVRTMVHVPDRADKAAEAVQQLESAYQRSPRDGLSL